ESKLQVADTGVYFLPQGKQSTPGKSSNKSGTEKKSKGNAVKRKKVSEINHRIGEKISFLYKRMNEINKVDTEEFSYSGKELFVPYYGNDEPGDDTKEKVEYRPDYILSDIKYLGFFQRSGQKTAIVRYSNGLNYLKRGEFLSDSSLSVKNIGSDTVEFRDNKTGEEIILRK
ncbi:MAG: hypothetical protein ACOCWO_05960, partial [Candidatus Muiribacteriaceae bacterium]